MTENLVDDHIDEEIAACLNINELKSFFLFAGAGSGKTRSLIHALIHVCKNHGHALKLKGRKIGVITYTNAACNEIKHRLDFNRLVDVSTIHSFVWSLIEGFDEDIKIWLKKELENDIQELHVAQAKGRAGKASIDRAKSIESKTKKLQSIDGIRKFTYSPNGENRGRASLNHSDVIKIGSQFFSEEPLMQSILVAKYPILLIDESQDTNKNLMEALLKIQSLKRGQFAIGLFGDTMQRIYADGKVDLGVNLPTDWARPSKTMNHRCPERIVRLINVIRAEVDNQKQRNRADRLNGFVRLFVVDNSIADKVLIEENVCRKMAILTGDQGWQNRQENVKTLILEHHMAAKRMGFLPMFEVLHKNKALTTGLLDGSLPPLRFFTKIIQPVVEAGIRDEQFRIASLVRENSPLITKSSILKAGGAQLKQLEKAKDAITELLSLFSEGNDPTFFDILKIVDKHSLFEVPETFRLILDRTSTETQVIEAEMSTKNISDDEIEDDEEYSTLDAWDNFLITNFSQLKQYIRYVERKAEFDTHQGVKGLQFPRVMVITDDADAKGFMFSYDKLFQVKAKTAADIKNEQDNADTSNIRTRRLLYVTCSRAEESLALVTYANEPQKVADFMTKNGWFESSEIEFVQSV